MEATFEAMQEGAVVSPVSDKEAQRKAERKQKSSQMKAAFEKATMTDPGFIDKLHTLSNDIEMVHTLCFGNKGGIVVATDETGKQKEGRPLESTGGIVGYIFRNNSNTVISYTTEEFEQDGEGIYRGTKVERQVAPGEEFMLSRVYTTRFASEPSVSFQFANGMLVRGSSSGTSDLKAELAAYYFVFDRELDANVHSDSVKIDMSMPDPANSDHLLIKPEYARTFGYLQNPTDKKKAARKAGGRKFSAQDYAAAYVREMVTQQDL